jgi:hypothetical protein
MIATEYVANNPDCVAALVLWAQGGVPSMVGIPAGTPPSIEPITPVRLAPVLTLTLGVVQRPGAGHQGSLSSAARCSARVL